MQTINNGSTILLAEDDQEVRRYLEMALKCKGYSVETAQDGEEALSIFEERRESISAVLLDLVMPRKDGLETLRQLRFLDGTLPVIMVSATSSPGRIVEAMKEGATDFLVKPVNHDQLCAVIAKALGSRAAQQPACVPRKDSRATTHDFVAASSRMKEIQSLIGQISVSDVPVLIQGETGVGKEVLARELHAQSNRAHKPFLKVNCASLPAELVESELFGYERGAFTGAFQRKPGMFEMADQGTILLDEIGDMDFKLQAKLLQVLQDQQFQRLGGKDTVRVDVRVIAATHRDLEASIEAKTFREDLYYRLNVINVRVPPLRERREDIRLTRSNFCCTNTLAPGTAAIPEIPLSARGITLLALPLARQYPGTRERYPQVSLCSKIRFSLRRNCARKSSGKDRNIPRSVVDVPNFFVFARRRTANPSGIPVNVNCAAMQANTPVLEQVANATREAELTAILAALKSTNWNRRQASALLRIDYKALLYKMKKLCLAKDRTAALQLTPDEAPAPASDRAMACSNAAN